MRLRAKNWLRSAFAAAALLTLLSSTGTQGYAQGTWSFTASMDETHHNLQTATRLKNGKVLVIGGLGANDTSVETTELYNPKNGTWKSAASMSVPRTGHTATRLKSGKVLVTGGFNQLACYPNCAVPIYDTAEIYDPHTDTWTATGSMSTARSIHTATLLQSGRVLVVGGTEGVSGFATAEIYNPVTGVWSNVGGMSEARYYHIAARLPDGDVLVAGGVDDAGTGLATAEIYDRQTGTWSPTGSMATRRLLHKATRLSGGDVLVGGGVTEFFPNPLPLASAEIYDRQTGTWQPTGGMAAGRISHTMTRLKDGRVLVTGGHDAFFGESLAAAEVYDPQTGAWSSAGSMYVRRATHIATRLKSGAVLIAGGFFIHNPQTTAELYVP